MGPGRGTREAIAETVRIEARLADRNKAWRAGRAEPPPSQARAGRTPRHEGLTVEGCRVTQALLSAAGFSRQRRARDHQQV